MSQEQELGGLDEDHLFHEKVLSPGRYDWKTLQGIIKHQVGQSEPGLVALIKVGNGTREEKFIDLAGGKNISEEKLERQSEILSKNMVQWDRLSFRFLEKESLRHFENYLSEFLL